MKLVEANVPDWMRIHVVHLHTGNVSRNTLKRVGQTNAKYVTIAKLIDRNTDEVLGQSKAACSQVDNPTRRIGRAIAIGRAYADYQENHSE